MKPYRGTLLAAAVLFATLPLSSCGDADDYAQTADIALSSSVGSVIVKQEVIFTVVATFPDPTTTTTTPTLPAGGASAAPRAPVVNTQCATTLEYQADGGGYDRYWREIPGTTPTRSFVLEPREVSPLVVTSRGKCTGSKEEWKYSNQVVVTVLPKVVLALPQVTLTPNPSSVVKGNPVTFTLSSNKPVGCTVKIKYQYSGAGFGITTVDPATTGQFILTPPSVGTLTVSTTAWCSESPAAQDVKTIAVPVTEGAAVPAPTLPVPTSVTLTPVTASPYSIATGTGVSYTLSAVAPAGCTLALSRQHSGAGLPLAVTNPTPAGTFTTPNPTAVGLLTIAATGWCTENPSAIISATALTITVGL